MSVLRRTFLSFVASWALFFAPPGIPAGHGAIFQEDFQNGTSLSDLGFTRVRHFMLDTEAGGMRSGHIPLWQGTATADSPPFALPIEGDEALLTAVVRFEGDGRRHDGRPDERAGELVLSLLDHHGNGYSLRFEPHAGHGEQSGRHGFAGHPPRDGFDLILYRFAGGRPSRLSRQRFERVPQNGEWLRFTLALRRMENKPGRVRLRGACEPVDGAWPARQIVGEAGLVEVLRKVRVGYGNHGTLHGRGSVLVDSLRVASAAVDPPPQASLLADPSEIPSGGSSLLSWQTANSQNCRIDSDYGPAIGSVASEGSLAVHPAESTTYTLTASGTGGVASASATVHVLPVPAPTIVLEAQPPNIVAGQSSLLNWSAANAQEVRIDNGIGSVDPIGQVSVSPAVNTTYTATAIGPGGTASAAVLVTVIPPVPTVSLAAEPAAIRQGEGSTLRWTASEATRCEIDHGIGEVPLSGSAPVTPRETTRYTITATGLGGVGAASAEVVVIPTPTLPTGLLRVVPESIDAGQEARLEWESTHADQCTLAPDIGSVALNGALAVSPNRTTVYTLTVSGPGGTVTRSATLTVNSPIQVALTSPLDNSTIRSETARVCGTVRADLPDVGILVNGFPALQDGEAFVVDGLPLDPGWNTLTAVATDSLGRWASNEVRVFCEPDGESLLLTAPSIMGLAPWDAAFRIEASFPVAAPELTDSGPGAVEYIESAEEGLYGVRLTVPGLYTFTVRATDGNGRVHEAQLTLQALDRVAFDTLLQEKWEGMKSALTTRDVEAALLWYHAGSRERYREILGALRDHLPQIAADMRPIELVTADQERAKYRLTRTMTIQGADHEITFFVTFSRDEGLWRIEGF